MDLSVQEPHPALRLNPQAEGTMKKNGEMTLLNFPRFKMGTFPGDATAKLSRRRITGWQWVAVSDLRKPADRSRSPRRSVVYQAAAALAAAGATPIAVRSASN